MNTTPIPAGADLPQGALTRAADGTTPVYNIHGYPLMVRAADFNAALAARTGATAAAGVPSDEPTKEMIEAGARAAREYYERTGGNNPAVIYRAMRAVAPLAAQTETQPASEADPAFNYAASLATALFEQHYASDPDYASGKVVWSLCDTMAGILTQIDNMVCGLVKPTPAQPASEAVALLREVSAFFNGPARIAPVDENAKAAELWKRIDELLATPAQPAPAPGAGKGET